MASRRLISMRALKEAFRLAEETLTGERNRFITKVITNEVSSIGGYEGLVNAVIARALHDTFLQRFVVKTEVKGIDVCLLHKGNVIVALEGKGMVSDSHTRRPPAFATSVGGIKTKLNKSVQADIDRIDKRLERTGTVDSHYQIFIPIIYELYRQGGEREWHIQERPWTTQPSYKDVRKGLEGELKQWFKQRDNRFELIRGTSNPIELRDANQFWQEQSAWLYPKYKSLEAYVSFFAFGRYVEK